MNLESNSSSQGTQPARPAVHKRSRTNRNRPTLVTSTSPDTTDITEQSVSETVYSAERVQELPSLEDVPATRASRLPKFFSNLGKSETSAEKQEAARLARATRNKAASSSTSTQEKPAVSTSPARPAPRTNASQRSAPRPGGFKMRYLIGIALYLLVADVLGYYIQYVMQANKWDGLVAQLGPITLQRSTLLFLALLVVILVLLARFDLVPRSLGAMTNQPAPQRKAGPSQRNSGSEGVKMPPTMKQGVKGSDDDLYQEYRENQRYLQRRERKR